MNLSDIIALAKQGYKPDDIKELINMADSGNQPTQTDTNMPDPTQTDTEPTQTDTENQTQAQTDTVSATDEAILKEMEALKAQLAKSNEALKAAQKANTQQNVQTSTQSDSERIADWARSFM